MAQQNQHCEVICMAKLVKNVVEHDFHFRVTYSDGHQDIVTVRAESIAAAGLLMPHDAVTWEPLEWEE